MLGNGNGFRKTVVKGKDGWLTAMVVGCDGGGGGESDDDGLASRATFIAGGRRRYPNR